MKFLAIKNEDTGKLGGLIVRDRTGRLFFTTANSWLLGTLELLLTPKKFSYEARLDERTIRRMEIDKKDEAVLDVLKTKILPPYVSYATGKIKLITTPQEAMNKIWSVLSTEEHQDIKEA
jgi:hypothetical protein